MEVSPNAIRKDTVALLQEINGSLALFQLGERSYAPAEKATLLQAKAQCLNTLVLLREQEARRKA